MGDSGNGAALSTPTITMIFNEPWEEAFSQGVREQFSIDTYS